MVSADGRHTCLSFGSRISSSFMFSDHCALGSFHTPHALHRFPSELLQGPLSCGKAFLSCPPKGHSAPPPADSCAILHIMPVCSTTLSICLSTVDLVANTPGFSRPIHHHIILCNTHSSLAPVIRWSVIGDVLFCALPNSSTCSVAVWL